jgi:isopentenyldiphosphate isomerase
MDEQNIEVDENDNVIGSRPRNDFYTGKYIHRSTYLILLNSKNKILIQKRTSTKKWYPNLYTFAVARTVQKGESYEDSMIKGLKEKIGIFTPVKFLFKFFFQEKSDRAFRAVFIGKSDDEIKPNKKDIVEIKWIDIEKLREDIKEHPEKYAPPFIECMNKYYAEFYGAEK